MRGALIAVLVLAIAVIGGGLVASVAYQAGVSSAVTTAVVATGTTGADGATVVTPVVVPAHGWGWGWGHGPGFGLFGFFGFLFVLFLIFGLIRALTFRGRGWGGPGGPGGRGGWGGPGGHDHGGGSPWESRAHDTFERWHGEAHGTSGGPGTGTSPSPTAGATSPGG